MPDITHELALADLRHMLWAIQKARSIEAENGLDNEVGQRVLADIGPWTWGPKCLVVPLSNLISRCEANGGKVAAMDYYNMLIIVHQLQPSIAVWVNMSEAFAGSKRELPEPDLKAIIAGLGLAVTAS